MIKKSIGLFFTSDNRLLIAWYIGNICKMTEEINLCPKKNPNNAELLLLCNRIHDNDDVFYTLAPWLKKKDMLAQTLHIQFIKHYLTNKCTEIPLVKVQKYFSQDPHNSSVGSFYNVKAIALYGIKNKQK